MILCAWFLFRLSQLILIINLLVFVAVTAGMASGQEHLAVFFKFPWGSFLTEMNNIIHFGVLDAQSVWIAWFLLNVAITVSFMSRPRSLALISAHSHQNVALLIKRKAREIESDPDLEQNLKKLNQLLDKS